MPACFLLGVPARRPLKFCVGVTSGVTVSGGIKTRLGSKGAVFYLPAAGGFGSVGVFSSHLSLGEAAQWSQLTVCAGGVGGKVALAVGQVAAGAGGSSAVNLSKAHPAAGNFNASCIVLFPHYPSFLSFRVLVTSVL